MILLKEPNAPEILAMLGDIETRLQAAGHAIATTGSKNGLIASPNGAPTTAASWISSTGRTRSTRKIAETSISPNFWSCSSFLPKTR